MSKNIVTIDRDYDNTSFFIDHEDVQWTLFTLGLSRGSSGSRCCRWWNCCGSRCHCFEMVLMLWWPINNHNSPDCDWVVVIGGIVVGAAVTILGGFNDFHSGNNVGNSDGGDNSLSDDDSITKAIDGKTAKRLLFPGVLVLSTDLKVANVILVVIIVCNKRLSWYSPSIRSRRQSSHWHPWCILISWGCSWEPPWVKDYELFLNIFILFAK